MSDDILPRYLFTAADDQPESGLDKLADGDGLVRRDVAVDQQLAEALFEDPPRERLHVLARDRLCALRSAENHSVHSETERTPFSSTLRNCSLCQRTFWVHEEKRKKKQTRPPRVTVVAAVKWSMPASQTKTRRCRDCMADPYASSCTRVTLYPILNCKGESTHTDYTHRGERERETLNRSRRSCLTSRSRKRCRIFSRRTSCLSL